MGNTSMDFWKVRTRKKTQNRRILITGLSLVRKINILLSVCKTRKVYILQKQDTFNFVVYIFFEQQDFLIFYSLNIFVFK